MKPPATAVGVQLLPPQAGNTTHPQTASRDNEQGMEKSGVGVKRDRGLGLNEGQRQA